MKIEVFKRKANVLIDQLQDLINSMPQKGNTSNECQRLALQNALNNFEYFVNGTIQKDMEEDDE